MNIGRFFLFVFFLTKLAFAEGVPFKVSSSSLATPQASSKPTELSAENEDHESNLINDLKYLAVSNWLQTYLGPRYTQFDKHITPEFAEKYIKGDNYEDVDSFKVPDIHGVLNKLKDEDLLDNPEKVKELYDNLEKTLVKKKIGESFLEDLINYSSLKLIKKDLDEAKKTAEKKIKELKEESKKIGNGNEKKGAFLNARSKIAGLLLDVIEVLDMVKRGDISEPPVDDAAETPDTTILPKKAKMFLKRVKEYLSNVETTKDKIDKIKKEIT
ncbi:MAG: hypothetical protein EBZ47_10655, partial [Chlamydiae bacterium]|nr:hypothetical protein [Chlamydiota bacterium]